MNLEPSRSLVVVWLSVFCSLAAGSLTVAVVPCSMAVALSPPSTAAAAVPEAVAVTTIPRVFEPGKLPEDSRLGAPRLLGDRFHPWNPPTTLSAWEKERQELKERILVGQGLWPMPPLAPLAPVIHGKIERDDYTIEKVYLASLPGHFVTGNLYRPKNVNGKIPGVLCPHGHWDNGRMIEQPPSKVQSAIEEGGEKFTSGAKYFMQARMVGLARMGCTVFHYDMVGYCDSKPVPHGGGFSDVEATLRLQQAMGLQTINSIRALDFLMSLPEVDSSRIGVTGESGGGTQTFILGAIDSRPTVAFPAVMVSDNMQGGCTCENCCYLRIGTNNVALAAVFAPRPMAMSGAHDWTISVENKPLQDLKKIYGLYGQPDLVHAKAFPKFRHNYNQVAREMMYSWFNKHLKIGLPEPIVERDFVPLSPAELSVFDAEHPRPADAADVWQIKSYLTRTSDEQFAALLPADEKGLTEYRRVVGAAARIMLDNGVPTTESVIGTAPLVESVGRNCKIFRVALSRRQATEQVPMIALVPTNFNGAAVLWFDGAGKKHLFRENGQPTAAVQKLLETGRAVISADLFQTGEFLVDDSKPAPLPKVNESFAPYTFGYNRPLLAERVHDILTVIGGLGWYPHFTKLHLVGTGDAGLWVLLARSLAQDSIDQCAVDLQGFGFSTVTTMNDPRMLPGGLKYGGIGGLAALSAPNELAIFGTKDTPATELAALKRVYQVAKGKLKLADEPLTDEKAVAEILK